MNPHQAVVLITVFLNTINSLNFDPCGEQFEIITDFSVNDCGENSFYAHDANSVFRCFPDCFEKYPIKHTECNPRPCPPGYICPESTETNPSTFCQLDENSCFKYYSEESDSKNPYTKAWWKPSCLPDGTWAPKQCKGEKSNGRCFCYDATGNRIFGQAFSENAANMTCACSRRKAELLKEGKQFYSTLHCDSMGNYEPLQCDNNQCWCAEPQTGEIIGKIVPEGMMTFLPCYLKEDIGEQYMRQCESNEFAQAKISHELSIHGTDHVNFPHVLCDADGTYGSYQITNGMAYCKWRDNSVIGSYASSVDQNLNKLNCNCARDTKLYELLGLKQNLLCLSNGNYKPQQQLNNGDWYCVDEDGFRKSPYLSDLPTDGECAQYI